MLRRSARAIRRQRECCIEKRKNNLPVFRVPANGSRHGTTGA
jgi:hypothetical protein